MDVSDLILADYAAANPGGKFTLVGAGITNINAKRIPCVQPLMFLLVRLKVTRRDVGLNKIEIRLVGEKGTVFKADVDMQVKPEHNEEQHLPAVIQMVNTKFEEFGTYNFEVSINGDVKSSQILTIRQEPQPAQASS